jgi:hypothetical protein
MDPFTNQTNANFHNFMVTMTDLLEPARIFFPKRINCLTTVKFRLLGVNKILEPRPCPMI